MSTIAPALLLAVKNNCGGKQKNTSVNFPAPLSLQRKTSCLRLPSALTRDTATPVHFPFCFFFPRTLQTFSFPSSSFFTDTRGKLTKGNKTRENVCYAVHTGQFLSCVLHYQSGVRHVLFFLPFFFGPPRLSFLWFVCSVRPVARPRRNFRHATNCSFARASGTFLGVNQHGFVRFGASSCRENQIVLQGGGGRKNQAAKRQTNKNNHKMCRAGCMGGREM
ncbi:hypothetical protein TcCL_NonESM09319 [Trypanosoma cruzi]|nr:hypothetical protein TcCL_NonESM09319 [Trypanosoma cruzi]